MSETRIDFLKADPGWSVEWWDPPSWGSVMRRAVIFWRLATEPARDGRLVTRATPVLADGAAVDPEWQWDDVDDDDDPPSSSQYWRLVHTPTQGGGMTGTEVPERSLLAIANDWIDGVSPGATKFKRGVLLVEFRSYLDEDAQAEFDREVGGRAIVETAMGIAHHTDVAP